ncbi:cytochrome P450 27C1-like [Gigantopelta aegis]|uniref:cytochrome P450 27C1-like n=1 Tax=Gigantopelta aegis TaxID=1735272 RepID=UPI001B88A1F1|nr:cytochrome P450 27C1-like [Gigantopelta aegis]
MAETVLRRIAAHGRVVLARTRRATCVNNSCSVFTEATDTDDIHLSGVKEGTHPKTLAEMPGPPGLPFLGTLPEYARKANQGQFHEVQRRFHHKYGKIFKEPFGSVTNVSVADPSMVEEILRAEGKYPLRPPYESWVLYNKMRNRTGGIMTADGEQWRRCRSAMNSKLNRPKCIGEYVDGINTVVTSLVERLRYLKNNSSEGGFVPQLPNEINKFTMEALVWVILEMRLGCLDTTVPPQIQEFITSVTKMFLTGSKLVAYANIQKMLRTKVWKEHVKSWDVIHNIASEYINSKMVEVESRLSAGIPEGERVDFLTHLMAGNKMTKEEITNNIIEILMGGVDTAANSMSFLFYSLAKHSGVQKKLQTEVDNLLGGRPANYEDLQSMPYLKAVVKETLRMYPPIPVNARIMQDDITIDNYTVPKGTCILLNNYTMSRDATIFNEPESFIPERWLREESRHWHPFSAIPFGYGARACIGRRLAETEMYLATIQICQNFSLVLSDKFDITPSVRTQLTPGPELPIQLEER